MDEVTRAARQARSGDSDAVTTFVRATQADVWRLCAHLVDTQSADDLTQQTYLRALRSLPRFRGDASARTWLLSIARRTCMDELRARYRRQDRPAAREPSPDRPVPGDATEWVGLTLLLERLDPDRRTAFVLTQILGCSYQEAADACHCPVGTIRSRVARARDELIAAMGERGTGATPPEGRRRGSA